MFKDVLKTYIKLMTQAIIFFHSDQGLSISAELTFGGRLFFVVGGYAVHCSIRVPDLEHEMAKASISNL